jgi:tape measure domain-containing protein
MADLKYTVGIDTRGASASLASLEKQIGSIGTGFKALAGAAGVGGLVAFTDNITNLQNKLRSLTPDQRMVASMFDDITKVALAARTPLRETGDLYFRIARNARDLGLTQDETARITESLSKSLSMTGMSAQESSGALLQLGQALQSGRFQGDELRSVLENMPVVAKAMADELGVTVGQLRELGSQGKITADVFVRAMQRNEKAIDDAFKRTIPTAEQAINNLKTAAAKLYDDLKTQGADAGPSGAAVKQFDDFKNAILKISQDIPKLTMVLKELADVLVVAGIAFGAMKAVGLLAPKFTAASEGAAKLGSKIGTIIKDGTILKTLFGGIAGGATTMGTKLASAFSLTAIKGSLTTFANLAKNIGMLIPLMLRTGNIANGLRAIFGGLFGMLGKLASIIPLIARGFLKFIPIAGWIWTIWEAVDALLKLMTGNGLIHHLKLAAKAIDDFFQRFLGVRIIDWAWSQIQWLWGKLGEFYSWLTGKSSDVKTEAPPKVAPPPAPGGSTSPFSETGEPRPTPDTDAQIKAFKDIKKAILEVTRAYKEQVQTRLEDLQFQLKSLGMSEDAVALEQQKRDILNEEKDALRELAEKEQEIRDNNELTVAGRKNALALVEQQRVAIRNATQEELKSAESTLKAIQAKNLEIEKGNRLIELQQQANTNRAALDQLSEQINLIGLYGDELENATLIQQNSNELKSRMVELDNMALDLEKERTRLGEERYAAEMAHITALRTQATDYYAKRLKGEQALLEKQKALRQDASAGGKAALTDIAKQFEPYKMAQDAVALGWQKVSDALNNFIDTGKFSFKDFARSILADLTKMIAQALVFKYIFNPIMGALGLSIPTRAKGGPVGANQPYIIGEKGPELFVPKSAGTVIPNDKLGNGKGTATGMVNAPVTNNYITNNISALDAKSVAQLFAENRKTLLGTVQMAQKEMPYGV